MEETTLVPARMMNEFVYCPRLCFIEWISEDFRDSVDTVEGRYAHRRVDKVSNPDKVGNDDFNTTAIQISAPLLGAIAKIDTFELRMERSSPLIIKKGRSLNMVHWSMMRMLYRFALRS